MLGIRGGAGAGLLSVGGGRMGEERIGIFHLRVARAGNFCELSSIKRR
jgi:hypothetical protein